MPRAPRQCPGDNYQCPNLVTTTKFCPDHTKSWQGQRTTSGTVTRTTAWQKLRPQVLNRDNHRCQIQHPGCTGHATQVDHIINTAAGGAKLDPDNCQAACRPCNARKAQQESAADRRRPPQH